MFEKLWRKLVISENKFKELKAPKPPFKLIESPEIDIGTAWRSETRKIHISQSLGKISTDIVCPYPPGIPLIVPGERIDKERLNWIESQCLYNKDLLNSYIGVLDT